MILILSRSSAFAAVYHSDGLQGDVAISSTAGPVWPMKKWAYYDELKNELKSGGLKVNTLQSRSTVLEHLADVQGLTAVWFLAIACPCTWRLGAACDVFPFLAAPVHGKYMSTDCRRKLSRHFWRGFSISAATIDARPPQSVLRK